MTPTAAVVVALRDVELALGRAPQTDLAWLIRRAAAGRGADTADLAIALLLKREAVRQARELGVHDQRISDAPWPRKRIAPKGEGGSNPDAHGAQDRAPGEIFAPAVEPSGEAGEIR
jgi:hypothetical protein